MDFIRIKSKLPNKLIIVVAGSANTGKTSIIKRVKKQIVDRGGYIEENTLKWGNDSVENYNDFRTIIKETTTNLKIGFISAGDISKNVRNDLELMSNENVDIIICACREEYPQVIREIAPVSCYHGYIPIWFMSDNPYKVSSMEFIDRITHVSNEIISYLFD